MFVCPKAPLEKVISTHAPLKIFTFSVDEKTSAIKEALTLMGQLQGDAKVIQERVAQLSLEKKELDSRLHSINAKFEQLSILSCEKTKVINKQELEVARSKTKSTPLKAPLLLPTKPSLAMVCKSIEAICEEFKSFKWKL
ncbi:hypothetical protein E5676_scaffold113G001770 [Cucumis melo var. makuwa]|uniref:Uncharacterized protein n=1 Tax=Cucumis melo var. makuwa TaxID=1194695 RepID=A0A5D3BUY9_CUCMM|nr:hypothetical protein E6C27_scaffold207G001970 [Cucumis melo var. makuwa]TYK01909.1 hypothetical protein E5676_scaffold113G001770 [Cucumis melo var. makuwa]